MTAHFNSLTLVDCPPIGNRHYKLSSGINFLIGNNGAGKTSIAMALRDGAWPYGGRVQLTDSIASDLIRSNWSLSYIEQSHDDLSDPLASDHWVKICAADPAMQKRMGALLSVMVSGKLGLGVTKFHNIPFVGEETFAIDVSSNGALNVKAGPALQAVEHFSSYDSINDLFQAASERSLISIVGILVAREAKKLSSPLILDGFFSLGGDYGGSILRQLGLLGCQVIILESEWTLNRLRDLGFIQNDANIQAL
jgi:hypothetical protein